MDQDIQAFVASDLSLASEKTIGALIPRYYDFLRKYGVEVDLPETSEDNPSPAAERHCFEIMRHRLLVTEMAAKKCLFDGLDDGSPEREELRNQIIRLLWVGNMWRSPWNDLLYQEFPGKHFGPQDMAAVLFANKKATEKSAEQMSEDMMKLLEKGAYGQANNTHLITYELSLLVLVNENRLKPDPPLAMRYQAKEIIRGDTARWYDDAWSAVLNKYFPKK